MMPSPVAAVTGVRPPPPDLPASHFAAALAFLLLGGAGLVLTAPELAAGAFLSPRVAAVTHLFTLGWITTSIMGALYQILPIALQVEIRWLALARLTFVAYVPGLLAFVGGMAFGRPGVLVGGAALLGVGVILFVANLGATLARVPARDVTWWALASAAAFLLLTLVVGGALAANLRWPFMGASRLTVVGTHLHVALVGWVLLVMVGVGQRLLPMFLLSDGADGRAGKAAVGLLASGAMLLFALHHVPAPWARSLPAVLMAAGACAFLVQVRAFYATGRRPALDVGLRMAAAGAAVLGPVAAAGLLLGLRGFDAPHLITAYVATLVLGISLFVAGHYYKIVPFLVWYHRFAPRAGTSPVPLVRDLYSDRWAALAGLLLVGGVVGLALSLAGGTGTAVRAAALAFAAGAAVEAGQMAALARRRPA